MLLRANEVDEILAGGGAHFREPPPPIANDASELPPEPVPAELCEELVEAPPIGPEFSAPANAIPNQKVATSTKCAT